MSKGYHEGGVEHIAGCRGGRTASRPVYERRSAGSSREILEAELSTALGRARYARSAERLPDASESGPEETNTVAAQRVFGHRNGRRDRELMGTFGKTTISVPRARVETSDGGTTEWKSKTLTAYRRRTKEVEALIAGSYLAGTNTRRVRPCPGVTVPRCYVEGHGERARGGRSRATGRHGISAI